MRLIDISGLKPQSGTSDTSHQQFVDDALSLLQQLVVKIGGEGVKYVTANYLESKFLDLLLTQGFSAKEAGMLSGKVFGKLVPIAELPVKVGVNYWDDSNSNPTRGGLEESARLTLDLSAYATTEAAGLALGTFLIPVPVVGTAIGGAVGFELGFAYDTFREPIQQGLSAVGDFLTPNYVY